MRPALLLAAVAALLASCAACTSVRVNPVPAPAAVARPTSFDHAPFTALLRRYVDGRGLVDYAGLKADPAFPAYLRALAATDPAALPEPDRPAFWLNAYNASALKLIVDNYPTRSILRLSPVGIRGLPFLIPKTANTPFRVKVARVGGRRLTLDDIEHGIVRATFREPRVHAALVCAAMSCPPLRRTAYAGDSLGAQLDSQMRTWLRDRSKNRVPDGDDGGTAGLSPIFKWFEGDFGGSDAAVQRFIAPYFDGDVRARLEAGRFRVDHRPYSWTLNDQRFADDAPRPDR